MNTVVDHYSLQKHLGNVEGGRELESTLHVEAYSAHEELGRENFDWGDEFFDTIEPSAVPAWPTTVDNMKYLPTGGVVPDHPPSAMVNLTPEQLESLFPKAYPNVDPEVQPYSDSATHDFQLNPSTNRHACNMANCSKSYKRRSDLQRHQLSHSFSRDYACRFGMCKRAGRNGFKRKDHLKQHLEKIHGVSQ